MSSYGASVSAALEPSRQRVGAPEEAPASTASRARVLIIDDQPMARAWARGILETEFECRETGSVQEFFELALSEPPDVILADLEMVPLSGIQLCRLAKAKPALAAVPFLLLTARESAEDKISSLADGVDDHLAKSMTPRELLGRVRATVRLRRSLLRAANLEALVEQRTSELKATSERLGLEMERRERLEGELRLAQKLEAVGQLAAGVAHEINTPLQYVGDSIQFLEDAFAGAMSALAAAHTAVKAASPAPATLAGELAAINERFEIEYLSAQAPEAFRLTRDGVRRVRETVRALTDFVSVDQTEHAPADLNAALRNVLTVTRCAYKDVANLELDFGELPQVFCHAGELNQAFASLIVNAAEAITRAMNDGQRGTIRVRTRAEAAWVSVDIDDSGPDLPEALRERIFEPIFSTKTVGLGVGQGLAVAHRIVVENHGGKLACVPLAGGGTRFTLALPLAD